MPNPTPTLIRCKKCGYVWETRNSRKTDNYHCPHCDHCFKGPKLTNQTLIDLNMEDWSLQEVVRQYSVSLVDIQMRSKSLGLSWSRERNYGPWFRKGLYVTPWWVCEVVVELIRHELQETATP